MLQAAEEQRRRAAQQSVYKAAYKALPTAQKAQYVRALEKQFYRAQSTAGDKAKAAAASTGAGASLSCSASGRTHGGSTGSFGGQTAYAQSRQQKEEARREIVRRGLDLLGTASAQAQRGMTGTIVSAERQLAEARGGSTTHTASSGRIHGGSHGSFGTALGYGKAIGGATEAGLWNGSVTAPLNLAASKIGQKISSDDTDTWLGKPAQEKEREINAAFLDRLGRTWAGYQLGDGSFDQKLKDTVFTGYNSAFQNFYEGSGRTQSILSGDLSREALYLGTNVLFHALKKYALPAITGSHDKDYNAKWLTEKVYDAGDKLTEKVSSLPGLRYVDRQNLQKDLDASAPSVRLAGNVSQVVANMLPSVGISVATGSPDAGLIALSASSAGNAAKEAYESGATPEQAYYIGLEKGCVEYLSSGMFDALGAFGGGALTPAMKRSLGDFASSKAGRGLVKIGGILGENIEEGVSDWAGTGIERANLGHTIGNKEDESITQALAGQAPWTEDGFVTLLSTLTLNGGGQIANRINSSSSKVSSSKLQPDVQAYLDQMERLGYVPPESSENAAPDGAAEDLSASLSQGSLPVKTPAAELPFYETDEATFGLWSKAIGLDDTVKTLADYEDIKYNDPPRYELIQRYADDVEKGWISPLCRFENYERLYNRTQNEIVGRMTPNGIAITGQSRHFLQRMIGTMQDPVKFREEHVVIRRSGVEFEDVLEALNKGQLRPIQINANGKSQKVYTDKCVVTINPDTGVLIQCNP